MGLAYGVGYQPISAPSQVAQPPTATQGPTAMSDTVVIDGTPVRVVIIALSAAAALTALKWGGFRFNVGVST